MHSDFAIQKRSVFTLPKKKPIKRANGTGTIIDFGTRAHLRYGARVTVGIIDGKQTYKYIGRWQTRTEAQTHLDLYNVGMYDVPSNITLSELYREWSDMKYKNLSPQRIRGYSAAFKKFSPLHNIKFGTLRTIHYQNIIDSLNTGRDGKNDMKVLLSSLYKYAMQNDIADKNYAQFITLPKKEKKDKEIFSDEDIKKLWQNTPDSDIILILIYTGFRIQELLNISKSDIDIENMIIQGGIKSEAGKNRIVPIHHKIQPIIKKYYDNKNNMLFTRENGDVISQDYFRRYMYYPLLDKLGIEKKSPHSTRHTFASILSKNGAGKKEIQTLLGHTDYAFTANVYTHTDVNELKKAVEMF